MNFLNILKVLWHFREPIQCGSIIRLTHLTTKKNLHSHLFNSPLSGNQEVSAYGNDGEGDTGDHWYVDCSGDYWERDDDVRLKHADTGGWDKQIITFTGLNIFLLSDT